MDGGMYWGEGGTGKMEEIEGARKVQNRKGDVS